MNYSLTAAIFSSLFLAVSFSLAYSTTVINESDTSAAYWSIGENMSESRNELTAVSLNDKN